MTRYFLIIPFVDRINYFAFLSVSIITSIALTLAYYAGPKKLFPIKSAGMTNSWTFRLGTLGFLSFGFPFLLGSDPNANLFFILAICCIVLDMVFVVSRFVSEIMRSMDRKTERFHVHTCFSHDCQMTPEAVCERALADGVRRVYVTDHADTFSEEKYELLKRRLDDISRTHNCELVPGLEYPLLGQHFLAINLKAYVEADSDDLEAIVSLKHFSDRVIWAHPYLGIRKLFSDKGYLTNLIRMMALVDGVEWFNCKSTRSVTYYGWRYLLISFLTFFLHGRRTLIIGMDAHSPEDWFSFPRVFRVTPLSHEIS